MSKILLGNLQGLAPISEQVIIDVVDAYLNEHPVQADETALENHITDSTPHPAYDDIASGRWVSFFKNGMA